MSSYPNPASHTQPVPEGGRPSRSATQRRRKPSSTGTVLLSVAGVLVAALYVGSLTVLRDTAASADELAAWAGPAALSAMIAMYAVIAAFVLAFTGAVRSTDKI